MNWISKVFLVVVVFAGCGLKKVETRPDSALQATRSLYDIEVKTIDGEKLTLGKYRGKKLLIVNTASECGYTPQYKDLQALHAKYGDRVEVLGFPANNFGGQEPGSNKQIKSFCEANYGVSFQMFEKIDVVGNDQHPLYQWLTDKSLNGWNSQSPGWNFCKYLIGEDGQILKFYGSKINPMSKEIIDEI